MKIKKVLRSKQDDTINIVYDNNLEARYVQRTDRYVSLYVSSQDGCNKACRMCHLTQTGQTSFNHVTIAEYVQQLRDVWNAFLELKKPIPSKVHVNFMARGEPLANPNLIKNLRPAFWEMEQVFSDRPGIEVRFNISTIMPTDVDYATFKGYFRDLEDFNYHIYYSMYSTREAFRKRWLPKAMSAEKAVLLLRSIQKEFNTPIAIHHALISGENDTINDILDIGCLTEATDLNFKFNLVRYNPYSPDQGKESTQERRENYITYMSQIAKRDDPKIVSRVGFDVAASCGMFVK